jgi:hypothetical protein
MNETLGSYLQKLGKSKKINKILKLFIAVVTLSVLILIVLFRLSPATSTHLDTKTYPNDKIEPFENSYLIGLKTPPQRGSYIEAGIFIGYEYQRWEEGYAYHLSPCLGLDLRNKFEYTDRINQVVTLNNRRCIGVIAYSYNAIE